VALGRPAPAGRAQRRARPGGPRRRAPRDQPRQPRAGRRPVHHAHPVGGHPVPGPPRRRPRAPAHPVGVPLRAGGRGRVDGRGRGPGGDAPRRPAADPRLGLPRPPEHLRHPDGLAGRARHPAGGRDRPGLLRVRPRPGAEPEYPGPFGLRTTLGPARAHPGRAGRDPPGLAAGRLPLGAHRRGPGRPARAGSRGPPRSARAGPRRRPVHQPDRRRGRADHHADRVPPAGRGRGHPPVAHLGVLGLAGLRRHRFGPAERRGAPAGARRHHRRPGLDRVLPHRRRPAGPVHLLRRPSLREAKPPPHRPPARG
jgi:hypothetical protein